MPAAKPVNRPNAGSIVPTLVAYAVQAPPPASVRLEISPAQMAKVPLIAAGNGLTVTIYILEQPAAVVKNTVSVPPLTPVNIQVVRPVVAIEAWPFVNVHEPPTVSSVKVSCAATQNWVPPLMAPGKAFTVTVAVTKQVVVPTR